MSYVKNIDYANQIANLLSEGMDQMDTGKTQHHPLLTVKEAIKNLNTDDREQLKDYAASMIEIKKQMKKLISKGKNGGREMDEDKTGGDQMHLTMHEED
jgi:hypothetical protein